MKTIRPLALTQVIAVSLMFVFGAQASAPTACALAERLAFLLV